MTGDVEAAVAAAVAVAADALYRLPAAEFTAARDLRAAEARRAGDREVAATIKKLRRPTVSAALANRLVRAHRDQVADLVRLGAAMRDAQAQLAGEDLRRLSQEGQQAVTALSRQARALASDAGQPVSDDVVHEVEETLRAALADPAASDLVQAGCLTTALRYSGLGLVGAGDVASLKAQSGTVRARPPSAPAQSLRSQPSPAAQPPPVSPPAQPSPPDPARSAPDLRQERIEAAERAVREAEVQLAGAQADASDLERGVQDAQEQRLRLNQQIRQLSEELEQLRADEREVVARVHEAERRLQGASRMVRSAAAHLAQAQEELDRRRS